MKTRTCEHETFSSCEEGLSYFFLLGEALQPQAAHARAEEQQEAVEEKKQEVGSSRKKPLEPNINPLHLPLFTKYLGGTELKLR